MIALLASVALAAPLPVPAERTDTPDYRRIIGLGAVASGGMDVAGAPFGTMTGEVWFVEAVSFGLGARVGEVHTSEASGFGVVPTFTWGVRFLSVHRTLGLDVVGRHGLTAFTGGFGATVEYRIAGPHLARATVLSSFDGAPTFELAYTIRWEH